MADGIGHSFYIPTGQSAGLESAKLLDLPMVDQLVTQDVILPALIVDEQRIEAPEIERGHSRITKLRKAVFRAAEKKAWGVINRPNIFRNEAQSIVPYGRCSRCFVSCYSLVVRYTSVSHLWVVRYLVCCRV